MSDQRITRRIVLGSVGAASISPAFALPPAAAADSGLAAGAPQSLRAFEAVLQMGPAQRAGGNRSTGWAAIVGGRVDGPLLCGDVQAGRVEWCVDEPGQMVSVVAQFLVRCADGVLIEVRDRAVHPVAKAPACVGGLCTVPELVDAVSGLPASLEQLAGRLDAARFAAGVVVLSAYRVV